MINTEITSFTVAARNVYLISIDMVKESFLIMYELEATCLVAVSKYRKELWNSNFLGLSCIIATY